MILDKMENAGLYASILPNMADAFAFARSVTEETPLGRIELPELGGFALLMEYETEPAEERKLETHKRFADIQLILSGREKIEWTPLKGLAVETPYDEEKDVAFWKGEAEASLTLGPGSFAIFLPADAHKPNCSIDAPAHMRKLVVKVPVD